MKRRSELFRLKPADGISLYHMCDIEFVPSRKRPREIFLVQDAQAPAAKAGRFLFEQEAKTYELTVLPWFALNQNTRHRHCPQKEWTSRSRVGISARAAICSTLLSGQAPKPLSGAPKAGV
jgi:hypothetical protein